MTLAEPAMMPPVVRLFALGVVLALLAAAVVGIYAVVLRLRGREVPPRVVRLLAGLVGAGCKSDSGSMLRTDTRRAFYPRLLPVGLVLSGVALLLGGLTG